MPLRESLGRWQAAQGLPLRWSHPEGLHLTLAFLGARPLAALPLLGSLGAAVAGRHPAFPLSTTRLGGFPEGRPARVLWLGLAPAPALTALASDLRAHLARADETFDAKAFRPHVTLARLPAPRSPDGFPSPEPTSWIAGELVLFESRPQGRYPPLRSWPLGQV